MRNIDEIGSASRLVYEEDTYAVIGVAMDVYYRLGCGFLVPVYQEALELELGLRKIPFTAQTRLPIRYKDYQLKKRYKADFVCFERIIVEIKAQTALVAVAKLAKSHHRPPNFGGVFEPPIHESPGQILMSTPKPIVWNHSGETGRNLLGKADFVFDRAKKQPR